MTEEASTDGTGRRRTQILQAHGIPKDASWDSLLEDLQTAQMGDTPTPKDPAPSRQSVVRMSIKEVPIEAPPDELDDLMASLGDTYSPSKVDIQPQKGSVRYTQSPVQQQTPPRYTQSLNTRPVSTMDMGFRSGDVLDDLIDNIGAELASDSLQNASKGICESCRKPIHGQVISAIGRTFHPEHFNCVSCGMSLVTQEFFTTEENKGICRKCYTTSTGLLCAHCNLAIAEGQAIEALGKKWHINHFVCTQCNQPFPGGSYLAKDNMPFCEQCYYIVHMPKCKKCEQPIRGDCVNAINAQWHPEHFNCTQCHKPLVGDIFFEVKGMPYCKLHANG